MKKIISITEDRRVLLCIIQPPLQQKTLPTERCRDEYHDSRIGNTDVITKTLDPDPIQAMEEICHWIANDRPSSIIILDHFPEARGICIETVFINEWKKEPVITGHPYFIPAHSDALFLANMLHEVGVPVELSRSASTSSLNRFCYLLSDYLNREYPDINELVVHVPWLTEDKAGVPVSDPRHHLAQADLFRAMELIIQNV